MFDTNQNGAENEQPRYSRSQRREDQREGVSQRAEGITSPEQRMKAAEREGLLSRPNLVNEKNRRYDRWLWGWRISGGLILLFAVCLGWAWLSWAPHRGITVAKVEKQIEREVPANCTRDEAMGWFAKYGIRAVFCEDTMMQGVGSNAVLVGLDPKDLSGMVVGIIDGPDVNVDLLYPGQIHVIFFFDKEGRRVAHSVKTFIQSP